MLTQPLLNRSLNQIKFQDLSKVVTHDGLCVDESKIAAFKEELNARIKKAAKENGD